MPVVGINGVVNPVQSGQGYQVQLAYPPATDQYNFAQLVGRLQAENPDLPVMLARQYINESYRRILDRRDWYGAMLKGQLYVPAVYQTGTATVALGSRTVTGVVSGGGATGWTTAMIGMQFRAGFVTPIYTIVDVDAVDQVLTLDLPWSAPSITGPVGYSIFQCYVSLGANIRRLYQMVNQRNGYTMSCNWPQDLLNIWDPWRTYQGWTWALANYPASSTGEPQFEMYPPPTYAQSFPFLAYVQPPDMVNNTDSPVTGIRGDLIVAGATPAAKRYRGRGERFYDPAAAREEQARYEMELQIAMVKDDDLAPGAGGGGWQYNYGGAMGASLGDAFRATHGYTSQEAAGFKFSWE